MYSISGNAVDLAVTGHEQNRLRGECEISQTRLVDESGFSFGVWQVSPGVFTSEWEGWEAFTIIDGEGTLEDGDGVVHDLVPGALIVIPPGSTGTWRITRTLRKTYVFPADSVGR
ncbi:MAG: cupin domain-containing protein [Microbacterium sp.]